MSRTILSFALRISYCDHIGPGRISSFPVVFAAFAPLRETKFSAEQNFTQSIPARLRRADRGIELFSPVIKSTTYRRSSYEDAGDAKK
ncbi:MAG: hypothetical protein DMF74_11715 [Acidobacteria bacterium]|nr:MAG: hypothetical protein DMF74_11715 [Acidobacteriota bacterium]